MHHSVGAGNNVAAAAPETASLLHHPQTPVSAGFVALSRFVVEFDIVCE